MALESPTLATYTISSTIKVTMAQDPLLSILSTDTYWLPELLTV